MGREVGGVGSGLSGGRGKSCRGKLHKFRIDKYVVCYVTLYIF